MSCISSGFFFLPQRIFALHGSNIPYNSSATKLANTSSSQQGRWEGRSAEIVLECKSSSTESCGPCQYTRRHSATICRTNLGAQIMAAGEREHRKKRQVERKLPSVYAAYIQDHISAQGCRLDHCRQETTYCQPLLPSLSSPPPPEKASQTTHRHEVITR